MSRESAPPDRPTGDDPAPQAARTDARAEGSGEPPAETERYGPLALRRLRKEDGRALIVYERRA